MNIIIILCFILNFLINIIPVCKYEIIVMEYDSYFNYKIVKKLNQINDTKEMINFFLSYFDNDSWYPYGRSIYETSYPVIFFLPLIIKRILENLRILIDIKYICVFIGSIFNIINIYFMTKITDVFTESSHSSKYVLCLISSFSPLFFIKTSTGQFDMECIAIPLLSIASYLYLIQKKQCSLLYCLLFNVFFGLLSLTWGGYIYLEYLICLTEYLILFLCGFNWDNYIKFSLTTVLSEVLINQIPVNQNLYMEHIPKYFVFFSYNLKVISMIFKSKSQSIFILLPIIVFLFFETKGRKHYIFNMFRKNNHFSSVAEHQNSTWATFYISYGFFFVFSLIGLDEMNFKRMEYLFMLLFYLSGIYISCIIVRAHFLFNIPFLIFSSYGISKFSIICFKKQKVLILVPILVIFLYISSSLYYIFTYYSKSFLIYDNSYGYFDDIRSSYKWLMDNTNSHSAVFSLWERGYQISSLAERVTLYDGYTYDSTIISNLNSIFISNENEAYEKVKFYDIDYIVVFFGGLIGENDDIGRYLSIASTVEYINISHYFNSGMINESILYKMSFANFAGKYDRMRNSIFNESINIKMFEEVYTSANWIVRIFKPVDFNILW